jgi:hypothetical protein
MPSTHPCALYGSPRFVIECLTPMQSTIHVYEVRPRKDKRGVDLISDALPFGRLWLHRIALECELIAG